MKWVLSIIYKNKDKINLCKNGNLKRKKKPSSLMKTSLDNKVHKMREKKNTTIQKRKTIQIEWKIVTVNICFDYI
jgi:hypothetical protein